MDITETTNEALLRELLSINDLEVIAGITDGEIAEYAAYNEFGTETIPARPFMLNTFAENEDKYIGLVESAINTVIGGGSVKSELTRVGFAMQNDIVDKIGSGDHTPNKQTTVKRKGSSKPLIDTGAMRQSVHNLVRKAE